MIKFSDLKENKNGGGKMENHGLNESYFMTVCRSVFRDVYKQHPCVFK